MDKRTLRHHVVFTSLASFSFRYNINQLGFNCARFRNGRELMMCGRGQILELILVLIKHQVCNDEGVRCSL